MNTGIDMKVIKKASYDIRRKNASYYFALLNESGKSRPEYAVMIVYDGAVSICRTGESISRGMRFFETVSRGTVTPCTLADIAADMGIDCGSRGE